MKGSPAFLIRSFVFAILLQVAVAQLEAVGNVTNSTEESSKCEGPDILAANQDSSTAIDDGQHVLLMCKFHLPMICNWDRNQLPIDIKASSRYVYCDGKSGENQTDCSLYIESYQAEIDEGFWNCTGITSSETMVDQLTNNYHLVASDVALNQTTTIIPDNPHNSTTENSQTEDSAVSITPDEEQDGVDMVLAENQPTDFPKPGPVEVLDEQLSGEELWADENNTDILINSNSSGEELEHYENNTEFLIISNLTVQDVSEDTDLSINSTSTVSPQSRNNTNLLLNSTTSGYVFLEPKVIKHPKSTAIDSNNEVCFTCVFDTKVDCIWVIDGNSVQFGEAYQYMDDCNGTNTTDCSLRIVSATVEDSGCWTCAARHPLGGGRVLGQPSNALLTVIVTGIPEKNSSTTVVTTISVAENKQGTNDSVKQTRVKQHNDTIQNEPKKSVADFIGSEVKPLILAGVSIGSAVGVALLVIIPAFIIMRIKHRKPKRSSYLDDDK